MPRKQSAVRNGAAPEGNTKAARTRVRILDAAAHVLSVKGYTGTRLTDVAEYAEIQAPAIYYYFGSREELIEEVMFAGIGEMRRYLRSILDALPAETSAVDKIMAAVEAHLRHELEMSDYTTASIRNSGQTPLHLRGRQRKEEAAYGRIWRKLFSDALEAGEIDPCLDVTTVQLLVLGALNWAAEWFDPKRFSLDAVVHNTQTLVRNGLKPASCTEHIGDCGPTDRRAVT